MSSVRSYFLPHLKPLILGLIVGMSIQLAFAWTAPGTTPPSGNVAGPITTGGNQTKSGSLTAYGGLAGQSFIDTDNTAYYLNPSFASVINSLRVTTLTTAGCDIKADASGNLYCGTDAQGSGGGGTVTSVNTGTGLTGGPITTTGTLNVDTTYLQRRITATCAAGNSIRAIAADGTVTCAPDVTTPQSSGTMCVWGTMQYSTNASCYTCTPYSSAFGGGGYTLSKKTCLSDGTWQSSSPTSPVVPSCPRVCGT